MFTRVLFSAAIVGAMTLGAPAFAQQPPATPQPAADATPPKPNDYSDPKTWLCRPGRQATHAPSTRPTRSSPPTAGSPGRRGRADPKAPIDCFYVYPTVSTDPTPNSDMNPDPAELNVVRQQFARFASKCQPYAPMYRQVTLAGLRRMLAPAQRRHCSTGRQYDDVKRRVERTTCSTTTRAAASSSSRTRRDRSS